MYADDLIILTTSLTHLQRLLSLCAEVVEDLDLAINMSKSHCMRIGPRFNASCRSPSINNIPLDWVLNAKFLGITLCGAISFKCDWSSSKKAFFCSTNAILGRLGTSAPPSVLLKLINSVGTPSLLYGISTTTLNKSELISLKFAYDSVYHKIFKSFDKNVVLNCQFFSGYLPFAFLMDLNRLCFLSKLVNNNFLFDNYNLDRNDFNDYLSLMTKYHISPTDSKNLIKRKFWSAFSDLIYNPV